MLDNPTPLWWQVCGEGHVVWVGVDVRGRDEPLHGGWDGFVVVDFDMVPWWLPAPSGGNLYMMGSNRHCFPHPLPLLLFL